ncbi:MAG: M14 family metallopeptidase [Actinomycetota bacterium]
MTSTAPLAATYTEARMAFLAAAEHAGATLASYPHPGRGPDAEELAVDVAELGPADADTVVMVVSATHGVEGFCGSALQRHWLQTHAADRPRQTRLAMVHALNPYGFAWVRRVNEDNVDLNRNFIDWHQPPPASVDYDRLADILVPTEWTEESRARTTDELLGVIAEWGFERVQKGVSGGQYSHPSGIFYGGSEPVWSHRWLRGWTSAALRRAKRVVIIDLHTGLGPWGHGELISSASATSPGFARAAAMWSGVRSMTDGDSVSSQLAGDWLAIADDLAPQAEVTAIALEYGTVDAISVVESLRADAHLHAFGDPTGAGAPAVRAMVRAAFADDDPAWIETAWPQFLVVIDAALRA